MKKLQPVDLYDFEGCGISVDMGPTGMSRVELKMLLSCYEAPVLNEGLTMGDFKAVQQLVAMGCIVLGNDNRYRCTEKGDEEVLIHARLTQGTYLRAMEQQVKMVRLLKSKEL